MSRASYVYPPSYVLHRILEPMGFAYNAVVIVLGTFRNKSGCLGSETWRDAL